MDRSAKTWIVDIPVSQQLPPSGSITPMWPCRTRRSHAPRRKPPPPPRFKPRAPVPPPTSLRNHEQTNPTATWAQLHPCPTWQCRTESITGKDKVTVAFSAETFPSQSSRLPLSPSPLQIPPPPPVHHTHPSGHPPLTDTRDPHGGHTQARRRQRRPPPVPPPGGPRTPPRRQAPPREPRTPPAHVAGAGVSSRVTSSSSPGWRRRRRHRALLRARLQAPHAEVPPAEEARGGQVRGALLPAAPEPRSARRGGHRVPELA